MKFAKAFSELAVVITKAKASCRRSGTVHLSTGVNMNAQVALM